ncbi:MAG: glycine--tRNA ligase subunit beta [Sphingopyxis sp.]|nr:glycine--tRNA ligase subunit beta [Sphingopyxis sp.]
MDEQKRVGGVSDFLLELLSEEIPARMQVKAKANLEQLFVEALAKAGLAAASIETFATPRRIALIAHNLPLATDAVSEETKGPKVGAPPQALEGFLRKTGLTQDQLVERDGVYFAVIDKPGRATADVLAEAIPALIRAFPWPKSMRWGAASASTESLRWVRPLSGIIALLGDDVVPCEIDDIASGRTTMGHRFLSSGPVTIANPAAYVETLRAAHVIVHFSERCALIRDGAAKAAADAGLVLVADEALVVENAGLTEWPVPLLGRFDEAFLEAPPEVIQLTARVNQKYFVCEDAAKDSGGKLANAFICTANIAPSDGGAAIVDGNRKVLAARLSDARFFWEQDQKKTLAEHAEKLGNIVFHEKLGTVADKVDRVAKLARWLCEEGIVRAEGTVPSGKAAPWTVPGGADEGIVAAKGTVPSGNAAPWTVPGGADEGTVPMRGPSLQQAQLAALAEQAARLCKADLVTEMVGEFPELQGIMGGYYAARQGLDPAVAAAIRDHYKPVGQGDDVPTAPVTVAVSLADKLDTLTGFFAINEKPTGSKDPFALRRAILGLAAIVLTNNLRGSFATLILSSLEDHAYGLRTHNISESRAFDQSKIAEEVVAFAIDRLKVQQREAGVRHDLIDAVFALGGEDDLVRLLARVKALQEFMDGADGADLLSAYKRAANLLKQSSPERGGGPPTQSVVEGPLSSEPALTSAPDPSVSPDGLPPPRSGEDLALLAALDSAEPAAATAVAEERFTDAMAALASLRAPIDVFFTGVMVNDPDPAIRAFRLGLLARFRDAVHTVADFSKIEG